MRLSLLLFLIVFGIPAVTAAYGESYYEGYYEGYYQGYYQGYYEASYSVNFTGSVVENQNLAVTGTIWKGSGTFVIDHPLDPKNMLLYHSFVESPDVKNLYDGVVTLDAEGTATIMLPDYFDALNGDARYQLSGLAVAMPNLYVSEKVHNNQFSVAGGVPGEDISWQVTAIRHDPYILAYPIVVEVDKGGDQPVQKGEYLHPDVRPEFPSAWVSAYVRSWFE